MPDFFAGTARLRMLSVVLALLAWIYVRFISVASGHVSDVHLMVPVTVTNVRHGLSAHVDPVVVGIVATGSVQSGGTLHAVVDLGGRPVGIYHLPVAVSADDTVLSLSPANVTVTIDEEEHS